MSTFLLAALALAVPAAAQQAPEPTPHQRAIAAGYKAAMLCSGIFNAGRTPEQVEALELTGIYPDYQALVGLPAKVDSSRRLVTVEWADAMPPRRAQWRPGTGCTNEPIGAVAPHAATSYPPLAAAQPDPRPWPQGDAIPAIRTPRALEPVVAAAFDGTSYRAGSRTTGVIVLRDGHIVAERYAPGFGPLVSNRTWSVAKSISGTLVGIAVRDGLVRVDRAARIPAWADEPPGDVRRTITLDHLLRMASGLHSDTAGNRTDEVYFGGTAVTEETVGWPSIARPGTRFRYANNDTMLAMLSLRTAMGDARYRDFPAKGLFEPLGMARTVAETDWRGNYILSSQVWSTARDLARLGELWRNDGVWQGKRVLPEGWVKYMTTPSGPQPAGDGPGYGATLWLFGPKQGLPEGSYAAQGNRGQFIFVIPSAKLVVVRRGEDPAGNAFEAPRFVADVLKALE
ncbi:beta-lactamase family protein [Sphingomonas sp. BT-65]|uniref:serine hydrolase domain-containing protein n=1 Tax=Sphingomonas sp. BT-65 TaxID=2989821 RepID=UPI002235C6A8|nr:serine hydrolase domain-containing protein [Sphingomonas sp. BT-65]MCW4461179.1 beta-lactamase family protein [Sphingomonas sp. BT-65]